MAGMSFTYAAKWDVDSPEFVNTPMRYEWNVESPLYKQVMAAAHGAWLAVEARVLRVDVREIRRWRTAGDGRESESGAGAGRRCWPCGGGDRLDLGGVGSKVVGLGMLMRRVRVHRRRCARCWKHAASR